MGDGGEGKPHYAGHRERLRQRFRKHSLGNFQNYKALELLPFYVARQQDMKPVARRLIERFGTFQAVLEVDGIGESAVTLIQFVKQTAGRYLEQRSHLNIEPQDLTDLINACRLKMGALAYEQVRLVCLSASFTIVGEDIIAEGTIDQAAVYPRKVV